MSLKVRWVAFVGLLCAALACGGLAQAVDEVYVDVMINGERLEQGGLVHGDRTYIKLHDAARVFKGRFLYDWDINVAFVLTGNYTNLVADQLVALNPELDAYSPLSGFQPGHGIHHGMPGQHVTVSFIPSGLATGFGLMFLAGETHRPWFDQPPGEFRRHAHGEGYSQMLHVVDPDLIQSHEVTRVAFNGKALDISSDALMWIDDVLWVRLRDLAEASGGGVGWDVARRLASAKIVAGPDLTWSFLGSLNAKAIEYYSQIWEYVPGVGYRWGVDGPGLIVALDGGDRVSAFAGLFPEESTPWFPWFDQMHGGAADFPDVGKAFSQHIYVMQKSDIEF